MPKIRMFNIVGRNVSLFFLFYFPYIIVLRFQLSSLLIRKIFKVAGPETGYKILDHLRVHQINLLDVYKRKRCWRKVLREMLRFLPEVRKQTSLRCLCDNAFMRSVVVFLILRFEADETAVVRSLQQQRPDYINRPGEDLSLFGFGPLPEPVDLY